ncbi:MAG: hypothetical protein Pars92KO_32650 [Parasphingorhabdus sp.]
MNKQENSEEIDQPKGYQPPPELLEPILSTNMIIILGFTAVIATLFFLFYVDKPAQRMSDCWTETCRKEMAESARRQLRGY